MVQEKLSFKDIYYLELCRPFCSVEWNNLCNFGRWHYEKQFSEFISKIGSVVQVEMSFKRIPIWSLGGPPVQWSEPFMQILEEGIMGNIYVKLYVILTSGSGGDVV